MLYAERSFFGVRRITLDPTGQYHRLVHAMTLHGMQSLDPARRREALTYYHRTGPIGGVPAVYARDAQKQIGAVGLGAGSLASFAQPGQPWTYFEIDPVVLKLARDAHLACLTRDDTEVPADERELGKAPSVWLVMARSADDLAPLAKDSRWQPGRGNDRQAVWTDDYSSLLRVFRWR